jgi:hypothetical protein
MRSLLLAVGIVVASVAPQAHADVGFVMCPSGRDGVASTVTSCAFADNVRDAFYALGMPTYLRAYSPVTDQVYVMTCIHGYMAQFINGQALIVARCSGGSNAEVVVW